VAESSFDAWIKYYRQDENSPNAIASYYAKGSLVALALDLTIRARSDGAHSLDDVMRSLWRRYGSDFFARREGLAEDEFPRRREQAVGLRLDAQIRRWAYGTADLPLAPLLKALGVRLEFGRGDQGPSSLGAKLATRDGQLTIATAYTGQAAQRAGLSAGDTLVAIDGLRVDERAVKALLARRRPGERLRVHAFRRDELLECELALDAPPALEASLTLAPRPGARATRLLAQWLGAASRTATPAPRPARSRA
jgi:predicted metalloprotease with PDZ domain